MAHFQVIRGAFDPDVMDGLNRRIRDLVGESAISHSLTKIKLTSFLDNPEPAINTTGFQLLKLFWNSPLPDLFTQLYRDEPLLILRLCTLRYQRPSQDFNYVPWHLDANFFGFGAPFMTAWVPFHDVGEHSPGLDICSPIQPVEDARIAALWRTLGPDDKSNVSLDPDNVAYLFGSDNFGMASPALRCGDAMLFDQYILHRTQTLANASRNRLAIEFRMTSKTRFPEDVDFETFRNFPVAYRDREHRRVVVTKMRDVFGNGEISSVGSR